MIQLAVAVAALVTALSALLTWAYNPFQDQVKGAPVPPRWPNANLTWNLNTTIPGPPKVDNPSQVPMVLLTAFNSWSGSQATLNGQVIGALTVTRGADQLVNDPINTDCLNVVSFSPSSAVNFPTGAVAFTEVSTVFADQSQPGPPFSFNVCGMNISTNFSAILVDADIEFNTHSLNFSTATPPASGSFSIQAVATHEFGHALGLDHTGIAHAVMYPFGDTTSTDQTTSLATDDIVGMAFLYPKQPDFNNATGAISGKITLNSSGIFASHVVAVDTTTGLAVMDGLTNPDGTYILDGVPPGTYNVITLPLASDQFFGIYTLDDFSGWTCGYGETSPPCCDPQTDSTCRGMRRAVPTNYTGKFF